MTTKMTIFCLTIILVCFAIVQAKEELFINSHKDQAFLDKILAGEDPVPDSVDWTREYNVVSGVKDQGMK